MIIFELKLFHSFDKILGMETLEIKIVRMTKDDIDKVFLLEELVNPKHHWSKESFYNEIANNLARYYCAKMQNGEIVGFIGVWHILEEAHITNFAVHPDYRHMQIGQAIMVGAIEGCYKEKIKYITLEVRESNTPAINLYEKFLFTSIGMRKKYYQDNNENALIMFTQNIWYDKFKDNFAKIKEGINKIKVSYD